MLDRDRLLAWLREQQNDLSWPYSARLAFESTADRIEASEFDVEENDVQENTDG